MAEESLNILRALMQGSVQEVLTLICIPLGAALIVGLIIAIFQATTSIQEQTLTFLPKLIVILVVIALLGQWMAGSLGEYTIRLFNTIGTM